MKSYHVVTFAVPVGGQRQRVGRDCRYHQPQRFSRTRSTGEFSFGCTADPTQYPYTPFPSPQSFYVRGGRNRHGGPGWNGQGFYNLQQDVTWFGGFQSGMGLVYNGAGFGNTPTGIVVTFGRWQLRSGSVYPDGLGRAVHGDGDAL